jgi:genome maintenance exonuclease 1
VFKTSFADDYFTPFADRRGDYSIPELEQINLDGQRFYATPSGAKYPSMSTLVKLLSGDAIAQWRKRVGPEEAARVGARASRRGTSVHSLAENYLLGQKDEFRSLYRKAMPDTHANWKGLKPYFDTHISEVRASECRLYSHALRLAGTTDFIGVHNGRLAVIDFKTSGKFKKREWIDGYFIQGDGYGMMWEELTGETPEDVVIIMATDGMPEPQVFVEPYGSSMKKLKQLRLDFYKAHGV